MKIDYSGMVISIPARQFQREKRRQDTHFHLKKP